MTDADHALDLVRRAAEDLVPQLTERLERHGLAEIEVARGELRLRVAAQPGASPPAAAAAPGVETLARGPSGDDRHGTPALFQADRAAWEATPTGS